ncbi:MAG: hypothetical protein LBB60_07810 [Desulfovibrio sp.]|jgi:hypothetical protein|nr:hypothetical protein [Desulfovibrio sp.]
MKRIALCLLLLCLAACGPTNLEKLNGKWNCDVKASIALMDEADRKKMEMMPELAAMIIGAVSITVDSPAKKLTVGMGEFSDTSDFSVVSDSGSVLTLKTGKDTMRIAFKSNDTLEITNEGDKKKVIFTRAK